MVLLDGKILSAKIKEEVKVEVTQIVKEKNITPGLAVILVGNDAASAMNPNAIEEIIRASAPSSQTIRNTRPAVTKKKASPKIRNSRERLAKPIIKRSVAYIAQKIEIVVFLELSILITC